MAHKKLYLYLGKRDKKGIRVISIFPGKDKNVPATRVPDITALNLSPLIEKQITKTIHDNRMLWEPWLESADNFKDLKAAMKKRGWKNLPTHSMPSSKDAVGPEVYPAGQKKKPLEANTQHVEDAKTMLRKKS